MSGHRDPDLDDLFDRDPQLERYVSLLRGARLKPPPLDPGFRHALRRQLMEQAYDRYQRRSAPSILARLFSGPRLAAASALAAVFLIAVLLVANGNLFGAGQVQVTTIGTVSVDQPITVSFSQPMDHQSVEQAIQIQPATQVTYSWQGNNLVIQPSSGELAPNTQYHVTVSAAARTAPGTPLGKPATVAVITNPAPTPVPSPTPSPSPSPAQVTAEHSLGVSGQVVGFNADGSRVFYLTHAGDLASVKADGTDAKKIQSGVKTASVAPGDTAVAYVTTGTSAKLYLAGPDGSNPAAIAPAADIVGWLNGKPYLIAQFDVGPAGAPAVFKLPFADPSASLSPDGTRLVATSLYGPGSPSVFDIATGAAVSLHGQGFSWSPDSKHLAYWRDGLVYVSAADGSGETAVAKMSGLVTPQWSEDGSRLLLGAADGGWLIGSDGTNPVQLSTSAFENPLWAPGDASIAYLREGSIWVDAISLAGAATIDLGAASAVLDQYENARVKNDLATAAGLLSPSASPIPSPSPPAGDLKLTRFFDISSQATEQDARFTVRLIFAHGTNEVRYQDEQVVIAPTPAGLRIGSLVDSPAQDLGKGPTVNSVQVNTTSVVLVFDSDLDPATVPANVRLVGPDGQPAAVIPIYSHRKVTLNVKLTPGASYTLSVSGAVQDIAGHHLQGGFDEDFVAPGGDPKPTAGG